MVNNVHHCTYSLEGQLGFTKEIPEESKNDQSGNGPDEKVITYILK